MAVVCDITLVAIMPLVRKYIGSLPQRERSAGHLDKLRNFARPAGPLARHIDVDTVTPKAMAIAGFFGCEGKRNTDRRGLQLAANILTSRLVKKIREEMSIVYSIRCSSRPAWVYRDAGRFMAGATCDPANAHTVVEEVHKVFKEFAEKGPTPQELENAKKQIANNLDTSMREPSYWWNVLRHHDLHRRNLNEQKDEKQAFERLTAQQVQQAFSRYYTPGREFRVTAVPAKSPMAQEPADKQAAKQPSS